MDQYLPKLVLRLKRKILYIISVFFTVRFTSLNGSGFYFLGIPSGSHEHMSISSQGIFERAMVDEFIISAKSSKTFFDVGANIGEYSIIYKKFSGGRCHCWEPVMKYNVLHFLNQLINFRSLSHISFHYSLVGIEAKKGITDLNEFTRRQNIFPDLIKLDVEGAEVTILPKLSREFFKNNPKIYLEVHPYNIKNDFKSDPNKLLDFIYKNFQYISYNSNHWGAFKGSPVGTWRPISKDDLKKVNERILRGDRRPRGYGLILQRKVS